MSELAIHNGTWKKLQNPEPLLRPSVAPPDCAFCDKKRHCVDAVGRQFFVGELYPPCKNYVDHLEKLEADDECNARLKELRKITVPVPRPEGASKDCLFCKVLKNPSMHTMAVPGKAPDVFVMITTR